jgi:hypothetical protein
MIKEGDFTSSPAMRHILRALRKALVASVQEPFGYLEIEDIESHSEYPHNCRSVSLWHEGGEGMVAIYTTPPAAPDLQAELDATNRQVEILSDALAESRREIDALVALARADEREACAKVCEDMGPCGFTGESCAEAIRARGNT